VPEPTEKAIEEKLAKLKKKNKSKGENGIPPEILKYVGGRVKSRVSGLIKRIWQEERMPQQWRNTIICPIPKIGVERTATTTEGYCYSTSPTKC
jgi:hypothetical protein